MNILNERCRVTPNGINIEKRIAAGLTAFFISESEAAQQAAISRSYYYPCREYDEQLACDVITGFCVPK